MPKSGSHHIAHGTRPRRQKRPLVVALVYDGLCTFEFAIASEIFGLARPEMGDDWYQFESVATERGPLRAQGGLVVRAQAGLERLQNASLIVVPGWKGIDVEVPATLCAALRNAHARGARIASICSGAFVLAAAGLLAGGRAATHWRYAPALARQYPQITVDAQVLYVQNDRIYTSAGSAAGIDLMLHIVREEYGTEAANRVARRLVMPPHRGGGQAQYIERPVVADLSSTIARIMDAVRRDLSKPWSLEELARTAALSKRTFIRRFVTTTGQSPGDWVIATRLDEAKRLLESTGRSIEQITASVGFGSVQTLRHHFRRQVGLSPTEYRAAFAAKRDPPSFRCARQTGR